MFFFFFGCTWLSCRWLSFAQSSSILLTYIYIYTFVRINSFFLGNLFSFLFCVRGVVGTNHGIRSRSGEDFVEDVTRRMGSWSRSCGRPAGLGRRIRTSSWSIAVTPKVAIAPSASASDAAATTGRFWGYFQIPRRTLNMVVHRKRDTKEEGIC